MSDDRFLLLLSAIWLAPVATNGWEANVVMGLTFAALGIWEAFQAMRKL